MSFTYLPKAFTDELSAGIAESFKRSTETLNVILGPVETRRKGHAEHTQYTDAELQARDEAVAEWQKLTEELEAKGYLERGACYECAGELEPVTETEHHEWVYDETVEEHQARVNPTGKATVTFKVV